MLTPEQLQAAEAELARIDTEVAALRQTQRDCIDKAREYNQAGRDARGKETVLLKQAEPWRQAIAAHVIELRMRKAEQAKAEAAAKAAEPQPPNLLEQLAAQVAKLTEQLAAQNDTSISGKVKG